MVLLWSHRLSSDAGNPHIHELWHSSLSDYSWKVERGAWLVQFHSWPRSPWQPYPRINPSLWKETESERGRLALRRCSQRKIISTAWRETNAVILSTWSIYIGDETQEDEKWHFVSWAADYWNHKQILITNIKRGISLESGLTY